MSNNITHAGYAERDMVDRYLSFLGFVLLGYASLGKGFAYIGFPPLFIGEFCAVLGLALFFLSGRFVHAMFTIPSALLVLMMIWVTICTAPYIEIYGLEAVRDSVIIMYGVFALIVVSLIISNPARILEIVARYRVFIPILVAVVPLSLLITRYYADEALPRMPGSNVPIVLMKAGDAGVHLAGVAVAVFLGMHRASTLVIIGGIATFGLVAADNRAGMLAVVVSFALAAVMMGRLRQLILIVLAGIAGVLCLYFVETHIFERSHSTTERRSISAAQLIENVASIIVTTEAKSDVEGTKKWRLMWWQKIIDDTVYGDKFWTGRGFGVNLAEVDGFLGTDNEAANLPPIRSPHNAHMTILARAGVPGLTIWLALLGSWLTMLLAASLQARALGEHDWQKLFIFIACYGVAFLINASFDVALEGPMQGIWFWCLFGFGIGAMATFRRGANMTRTLSG